MMIRAHGRGAALGAALALALAACGGGGDGDGAVADDVLVASDGMVEVIGTDTLEFAKPDGTVISEIRAQPGELTVEMTCEGAVPHTFVIEETGDELLATCDAGQTGSGTTTIEAGDYTYYCDVPGHREAGMEGTLAIGDQ